MELTEDEIIQKDGKHCAHCNRDILLPYKYEWSCNSCGLNSKKNRNLLKNNEKKFINCVKYGERKKFAYA